MGRVCVGRLCFGPSLQWAEFAKGRDVQLPDHVMHFLSQPVFQQSVSLTSTDYRQYHTYTLILALTVLFLIFCQGSPLHMCC